MSSRQRSPAFCRADRTSLNRTCPVGWTAGHWARSTLRKGSAFANGGPMLTTEARPLDAAGRPRSPATMPGYHAGRPPRNTGIRYPADPPRVEEIVAVMREAGNGAQGARVRGLIVVLWRAGLRISEALSLAERDLDPGRGASSCATARAASVARSGWTTGAGSSFAPGSWLVPRCLSERCPASSTVRPVGDRGPAQPHERSFGASRSRPASDDGSLPTSFATPMRSRWPVREFR